MFDVATAGNVVSVRPGSGIISRCPECGRVIQKGNCRVHGKVEGVRDMRIKAVLDDGTGSMSVMFPRELAEIIYGKTLEEAEQLMFSDVSKDAVYEDLRRFLTGRYLAVRGNSSKDEYGISFVAEHAWVPEDDLAVRVVELLRRLGPDEGEGQGFTGFRWGNRPCLNGKLQKGFLQRNLKPAGNLKNRTDLIPKQLTRKPLTCLSAL